MSVFPSGHRDLTALRSDLAAWMRSRDAAYARAEIVSFGPSSSSAGYSNETYSLDMRRDAGAPIERFILRTAPAVRTNAYFPDYEIVKQFRVMEALHRHTDLLVPECRWLEEDPALFGAPFFLMARIDGVVPGDVPLYTAEGFVVEASDDERRRMWDTSIQAIASVGKVDWQAAELDLLDWPDRSRSRTLQHLEKWDRHLDWATEGEGDPAFAELSRIRDWLGDNVPADEPAGLLWGDPRFANFLYRDFCPVGLLDWEMASIGNPEDDLAYFLLLDRWALDGMGNPRQARPRLGGFGTPAEAVARYEALTGRPVRHFNFYWGFNGYKLLAMMQRAYRLIHRAGMIDAAAASTRRRAPLLTGRILSVMEGGIGALEEPLPARAG